MENKSAIYTTKGEKHLKICENAVVNGVHCLAYMKNDKLVGYIPLEDFLRESLNRPLKEFHVGTA